jgi:hypothetical protein
MGRVRYSTNVSGPRDEGRRAVELLLRSETGRRAVEQLYGFQRQVGDAGPGDHQVARLFQPSNAAQLHHGELQSTVLSIRVLRSHERT